MTTDNFSKEYCGLPEDHKSRVIKNNAGYIICVHRLRRNLTQSELGKAIGEV